MRHCPLLLLFARAYKCAFPETRGMLELLPRPLACTVGSYLLVSLIFIVFKDKSVQATALWHQA